MHGSVCSPVLRTERARHVKSWYNDGMKKKLLAVVAGAWMASAVCCAAGPKIIFDTDMYTDFDDVGAMAVLHALADAGECEILGTVVCTRGAPSLAMVEVINDFYGRASLPVGAPKEIGVGPHQEPSVVRQGSYEIYADYTKSHPAVRHPSSDMAPDANETYRRILAAQPDNSVTILTVGFLTNLRRLLETKGDAISPLDGKALVAKKVKVWYAMACKFPDGYEYNSGRDAESSKIVLRDWPTPVYFLDFNYGVEVKCGVPASKLTDSENPVRDVVRRALVKYREPETGHPSWDQVTTLAAVRGAERYFGVERGRFTIVNEKGVNHWTPDANGLHRVLTVKTPKAEVGRIVDELMARRPVTVKK